VEIDEGVDHYIRRVSIQGKPYYEVGVKVPSGTGYLGELIEITRESNEEKLRQECQEVLEKLRQEVKQMRGRGNGPIGCKARSTYLNPSISLFRSLGTFECVDC